MSRNTPHTAESFFDRADRTGYCWEWQGARTHSGYGQVNYQGRTARAHRVAWLFVNGPIPDGLEVCHSCDNRLCVRPDHLWLGTHAENVRDMDAKGRRTVPRGEDHVRHKLTGVQVSAIRAALLAGGSPTALARTYGVSKSAIQMIRRGQNWRMTA